MTHLMQRSEHSEEPYKVLCLLPALDGGHVWEAEVAYAVSEYACTAVDFLVQRSGMLARRMGRAEAGVAAGELNVHW